MFRQLFRQQDFPEQGTEAVEVIRDRPVSMSVSCLDDVDVQDLHDSSRLDESFRQQAAQMSMKRYCSLHRTEDD